MFSLLGDQVDGGVCHFGDRDHKCDGELLDIHAWIDIDVMKVASPVRDIILFFFFATIRQVKFSTSANFGVKINLAP